MDFLFQTRLHEITKGVEETNFFTHHHKKADFDALHAVLGVVPVLWRLLWVVFLLIISAFIISSSALN